MKFKFEKPIAFIKVYTTGSDLLKDRIIELSIIKYENGKDPVKVSRRYNPEMPISEEAQKIHGIKDEDLLKSPLFKEKASGLNTFLKDCDLVGFNIAEVDLPFLVEEFERSDENFLIYNRMVVDLFSMYKKINERTFKTAVKQYLNEDLSEFTPSNEYLTKSVELFDSMIYKHEKQEIADGEVVGGDMNSLSSIFNPKKGAIDSMGNVIFNESNKPIFNFGKHKDKLVADVCKEDPNYFNWITVTMLDKFSRNTIRVIKGIFEKANKNK